MCTYCTISSDSHSAGLSGPPDQKEVNFEALQLTLTSQFTIVCRDDGWDFLHLPVAETQTRDDEHVTIYIHVHVRALCTSVWYIYVRIRAYNLRLQVV